MTGGTKAVVIGAGLGGLSAAIRLATTGWDVTVFEASDKPGGKAGFVELGWGSCGYGPECTDDARCLR